MNGFVSKPVNAATLQSTLMGFFGLRGAPGLPATDTVAPTGNFNDSATLPFTPAGGQATTSSAVDSSARNNLPRPRQRFKPGDLGAHIDMAMVGDVCIGVSAQGYRSLLRSFFCDESGALDALLRALKEVEEERPHDLRNSSHAFKGAAANLGFHKLATLALQLEKAYIAPAEVPAMRIELASAWVMAHAMCLRMGLTDVESVLERHDVGLMN